MVILRLDDAVINSLSDAELSILRYVYEHETIVHMSIQELSSCVSYSSATILRFCKKLGFSGFAEFKYALQHDNQNKNVDCLPTQETLPVKRMVDNLLSDMEGTSKLIQQEQLHAMYQYFHSSCPIYLYSPGGITSILIDYFEKMLFSIGRTNVYKIESSKMSEHIIRGLSKDNLLIVISTTGNFTPTQRLVKLARMNDLPVLTITPYANNEIANLATINFRFFTNQRENNGAEYTSRLPVFYLIDMMIKNYLQYKEGCYATNI